MAVTESPIQPQPVNPKLSDNGDPELLKMGNEFVIKLHLLMKLCEFYGPKIMASQKFMRESLQAINDMLKREERLSLKIVKDDLFLNGEILRYSPEGFTSFKSLLIHWKKRWIGEVSFNATLDERTLGEFISLLNNLEEGSQANPKLLMEQLVNSGISSIEVGPLEVLATEDPDREEYQRQQAKKVFFQTITAVKKMVADVNMGKLYFNVRRLKRLAQKAVHLIQEDEAFLLGMAVIKNYDEYTFNHSVNVFIYSLAIGKRLGFSKKTLTELGLTALLHDVGKSKIPKEVLNKPGSLSEEEWAVMKRHPLAGVEIVLNLKQLGEVNPKMVFGIFEHHLKNNLSGYPKLFRKREINLFGQIIQIVDAYDAMTTPRVYKKNACIPEQALAIMLKERDICFDPILLKVFIGLVGVYPIGALVVLNTDELGIVYKPNPKFADRPHVILVTGEDKGNQKREVVDLAETTGEGQFKRSITKTIDPFKHHVDVAKYFL